MNLTIDPLTSELLVHVGLTALFAGIAILIARWIVTIVVKRVHARYGDPVNKAALQASETMKASITLHASAQNVYDELYCSGRWEK